MRIDIRTGQTESNRQAFSSTDLSKTTDKDVGIVFPLAEAKWQISVSSIVDHHKGRAELAHSESRICNVDNNVINYYKGRTFAYIKDRIKLVEPSQVETLVGILPTPVGTNGYCITDKLGLNRYVKSVMDTWDTIDYKANTDFIDPNNLTKKEFKQDTPTLDEYFNTYSTKPTKKTIKDQLLYIDTAIVSLNQIYRTAKESRTRFKTSKEFKAMSLAASQRYLARMYEEYLGITIYPMEYIYEFGTTQEELIDTYVGLLVSLE